MFNFKKKIANLKPIKNWHRRQLKKKLTNQAVKISYGGQDQLDFISYAGMKEESSYLQINDHYIRTLFVSGYPYVATTGWLNNLINFNHDIDISYHIEQVDPLIALPKLNRKITELESTKRTMLKEGKVIGSEITDPLESAMELKDKIQRGMEKLFQISIYMTVNAESLSELNKVTKLLETVMQTRLFYIKPAIFQQIEGLQSILPRSENKLAQQRNLDSSSAALTFPFVSSELVQESGILYGINKSNNSLVIIDRFSLNNANSIIFAQSGSGKSYTAKVEILRHLMQGTKVIIIDPEREYKQLAASVKGTYIRLSSNSKEKINPFQYSQRSITEENNLSEHIQDLTELISLMVGSLTSEERAVVDKALLLTYKDMGLTTRKNSKSKTVVYPLLKDFYKNLKSMKHKDLCDRLERFVKGSLSTVFDSQTNISLDNRLIVFDIKDLSESIRSIMMMVVANFVNNEVKQNPQKRMLVIDEGWILLQEPESARFISGLVRRARKYYLGVTIISQQANDFLNQDYGKAIASQSSLRVLMRQDTTTIKKV
ncbi:hypothetical protein COT86_04180, partial [Candidatus Collierbacteria bacterium CG10_big_fil_rev_8_21_14_0_10_43_36]